jgi:hypothetical protein
MMAVMALPTLVKAQQSNLYPEIAQGFDPARVDRPSRTVPQSSTEYAVSSLLRTERTTADASDSSSDADPKDVKSLVAPSVGNTVGDGFSEPAAYSEYKFAEIQDKRPATGLDGPQHNGIVGMDFVSYWDTIVGFNFTYTNENLSANGGPPPAFVDEQNSSNSYFFSPYIAKNFFDWLNVGGSFSYGRTDTDFQAQFVPGGTTSLDTTQDSYSYSPFIGVAHTWGAFSFSSTPTYIYGYDHFTFGNPTTAGVSATPPGDAKTLNQTFLWLNNFQYAVTSKLSVSIQANWTKLVTIQEVSTPGFPSPSIAHQWMSFGCRADYSFNKNGTVFAAFEHDAFNVDFDDYRLRTGITYNF